MNHMDYKEKSIQFKKAAEYWESQKPEYPDVASSYRLASILITNLLSYAEAAEDELEQREGYYDQMVDALAAVDNKELEEVKEKLKATETRAEKAERERDEYFKHLQGRCFSCGHRKDGFDCHAKCYGNKRGSAWVYAGPKTEG